MRRQARAHGVNLRVYGRYVCATRDAVRALVERGPIARTAGDGSVADHGFGACGPKAGFERREQNLAAPRDVLAHTLCRERWIACTDRLHDSIVVFEGASAVPRYGPHRPPGKELPETMDHLGQVHPVRGGVYRDMPQGVLLSDRGAATALDNHPIAFMQRLQLVRQGRRPLEDRYGEFRRERLEEHSQPHDFAKRRWRCNDVPDVRAVVDKAIGLQKPQRLSDRRRTHAQIARQFIHAQTLTGSKLSQSDPLAQPLRCDLGLRQVLRASSDLGHLPWILRRRCLTPPEQRTPGSLIPA